MSAVIYYSLTTIYSFLSLNRRVYGSRTYGVEDSLQEGGSNMFPEDSFASIMYNYKPTDDDDDDDDFSDDEMDF